MKVFVIGATGRVGRELIAKLAAQGHQVLAGTRHVEKIQKTENITPILFDLHDDVDVLANLLAGSDAVYFVAGSQGQDLLQTDLDGAVKVMQAAESKNIKRFIMLSALFALDKSRWDAPGIQGILDYYIAKHYADHWLVDKTDLDYTILQPGALLEEAATGTTALNVGGLGSNTIPDVAEVLAEILNHDNTIKKVIPMHSGDEKIADAVKNI